MCAYAVLTIARSDSVRPDPDPRHPSRRKQPFHRLDPSLPPPAGLHPILLCAAGSSTPRRYECQPDLVDSPSPLSSSQNVHRRNGFNPANAFASSPNSTALATARWPTASLPPPALSRSNAVPKTNPKWACFTTSSSRNGSPTSMPALKNTRRPDGSRHHLRELGANDESRFYPQYVRSLPALHSGPHAARKRAA